MEPIIHLKAEDVHIMIDSEEDITAKHNCNTRGAIISCIKHVYRYSEFHMTKDIMLRILWLAHKGDECDSDHFDISQRLALYEHLKDKDIEDPYVKQFMKETKENYKNATI